MSSSGNESHSVGNVSRLGGSAKPSQARASPSNHEEEDIPFRIVHRTCRVAGTSDPTLLTISMVVALVVDASIPAGPAGLVSTMTSEDITHLQEK